MKKLLKGTVVLASAVCLSTSVQAKTMTPHAIENIAKASIDGEIYNIPTYIFGKHVYFDVFTMADVEAAANTLDGATNAIIYYKDGENVWHKATTNEVIDVSDKTFEMIKLVGSSTNGYVSSLESLYQEGYLGNEEGRVDHRVGNLFANERERMQITNINMLDKNAVDHYFYRHNTESMQATFKNNYLELQGSAPLLDYEYQEKNAKWFGLLVETNKNLKENSLEDVSIVLKNYYSDEAEYFEYTIQEEDILNASQFGGNDHSFILWLKGAIEEKNATLLFTKPDEEGKDVVQTIHIHYTMPKMLFSYASDGEVKAEVFTEGVHFKSVEASKNKPKNYRNIFYTDRSSITEVDFTENNDKKVAVLNNNNWNVYEKIDGLTVLPKQEAVDDSSELKWNQNAFHIATNENLVTISYDKEFKTYDNGFTTVLGEAQEYGWYGVIVDLGINPENLLVEGYTINSVDIEEAKRHGATTDTAFVMWLKIEDQTREITFTNKNYESDQLTVTFVAEKTVEDLNFTTQLGDAVDFKKAESQEDAKLNYAYITNQNALQSSMDYEEEEKLYTIRVQATNDLETYSYNGQKERWFSLLFDFGVDPSFIVSDNESDFVRITEEDAKKLGAQSDTAFIVMINPTINGNEYTFKDTKTNRQICVKFDIATITKVKPVNNQIFKNVTVFDRYKDKVVFKEEENVFLVNDGTTTFEFTMDQVVYTYRFENNDWVEVKGLFLNDVLVGKIQDSYEEGEKYNQASIHSVTKKEQEIYVEFNRNIDTTKTFDLIVNFGINSSSIQTVEDVLNLTEDTIADYIEINDLVTNKGLNNYMVIHLDPTKTNTEEGQTLTFINQYDSEQKEQKFVVKSIVKENELDMHLVNAQKISLKQIDETDSNYENLKHNSEGVSIDIQNGNVVLTYDKPFISFNQNGVDGKWVGVLIDLGIVGSYVNSDDVIVDSNPSLFGGKDNQALVWLNTDSFVDNQLEVLFKNTMPENKFNTSKITFVLEENIEALELQSVRMADAIKLDTDFSGVHALNQKTFEARFDNENKKMIVESVNGDKGGKYENNAVLGSYTWYAVLVDFGMDPKQLITDGYTINEEDIMDANRHGAVKTEFVMWLKREDLTREITFKNSYNDEEYVLIIENK